MGKSTFLANELLDQIFGASAYTAPVTLYFCGLLQLPTDADTGSTIVEPSGGSYARVAVTNNLTNFAAASDRSKVNAVDITFPTATADIGIIVAWAACDASSAGNLLWFDELTESKSVADTEVLKFAAGDCVIEYAAS